MGSSPDNSVAQESLRLQQQEAARARAEEAERQRKLLEGTARINATFDGGYDPTSGIVLGRTINTPGTYYDYEGNPITLDYVDTRVDNPFYGKTIYNIEGKRDPYGGSDQGYGTLMPYAGAPTAEFFAGGGGGSGPIPGPDLSQGTRIALPADYFSSGGGAPGTKYDPSAATYGARVIGGEGYDPNYFYGTQPGVQRTGFGDDFYADRRSAYLDYYAPQIEDQYKKAQDQLTFALSRAGLLRSTVAGEKFADLGSQYELNRADIESRADAEVTNLRNQINNAKQGAISQLYATVDPDVATNTALSSMQAIRGSTPSYSPLADIFRVAAIGGGNFIRGYRSGEAERGAQAYGPYVPSAVSGPSGSTVRT